jgi:hypothetical protein
MAIGEPTEDGPIIVDSKGMIIKNAQIEKPSSKENSNNTA